MQIVNHHSARRSERFTSCLNLINSYCIAMAEGCGYSAALSFCFGLWSWGWVLGVGRSCERNTTNGSWWMGSSPTYTRDQVRNGEYHRRQSVDRSSTTYSEHSQTRCASRGVKAV